MDKKNRVIAVDRVLNILEYLLSKNWAISLRELSENLKIPKATVFRIVKTLETRRYVYSPGNNGKYALGAKAVSLGYVNSKISNMRQIANSFMFELANKTKQTVQLGILFEYSVMYIDQIRTAKKINIIVPTNTPFPVNLSAGGKILVANLPEEKSREFLKYVELKKNTPKSIINKDVFVQELKDVKMRGYATDFEEFARGIWCIAAPIFNHEGGNIASIGITGHTSELSDKSVKEMISQTVEIGKKISKVLGYQEN